MKDLIYAVAIDGPSGAGKSTLARRVAANLKFVYVDTGAIYRSIGWYALKMGVSLEDAGVITRIAANLNGRDSVWGRWLAAYAGKRAGCYRRDPSA